MKRLRNARRSQKHTGRHRKVQRYGRATRQRETPRPAMWLMPEIAALNSPEGITVTGFKIGDDGNPKAFGFNAKVLPEGSFSGTVDPDTTLTHEQVITDMRRDSKSTVAR